MVFYQPSADQCYEHEVDFLARLAAALPVHLIVERGGHAPELPPLASVQVQEASGPLLRILEHLRCLYRARRWGARVHFTRNSLIDGVLAGLFSRLGGGRSYIWSCGELQKGWRSTRRQIGPVRARLQAACFNLAVHLATRMVTGNATMKRAYRRQFGLEDDEVAVIPNWIDPERFRPTRSRDAVREDWGIPKSEAVILFPRSLSVRHGTMKLDPMQAAVENAGHPCHVVATGKGPLAGALTAAFEARGAGDRLRILGGVGNREMPDLFAASDVAVIPSDTEGFPRVVLEAMACGCPFVASNVGGLPDCVSGPQRDLLVDKDDPSAFAAAIVRILERDDLRRRLVAHGERALPNYTVDRVVDRYLRLFRRVA